MFFAISLSESPQRSKDHKVKNRMFIALFFRIKYICIKIELKFYFLSKK